MKYICLSFDDARADTFHVAYPILNKHDLNATVNVITEYVENPSKYSFSSGIKAMTVEELIEWGKKGNEIACHGRHHKNTSEDIERNIEDLVGFGIDNSIFGFASPESELTNENIEQLGVLRLLESKKILYVRSGIQVRREGLLYILGSIIERITHSRHLFCSLNKKNIFYIDAKPRILPSVAIKDYTSVSQVCSLIDKMKDNQVAILMLHSILNNEDEGYGKDHYYWDAKRFDALCEYLLKTNIKVITTNELYI